MRNSVKNTVAQRLAVRSSFKRSGFSLVEMLVSLLIFSGLTALSLMAFSKLQGRIQKGKIQAEQLNLLENVKKKIQVDVEGALELGAVTTNSIHFGGQRTFGIMPKPFEDPGTRISDGIQVFVEESEFSKQASFQLLSMDCNGGASAATIRVQGDFTPTETLSEDIFAITDGSNIELYTVEGNITVLGGSGNPESQFGMNEDLHLCGTTPDSVTVYRVGRRYYHVEEVAGRYQLLRETQAGPEVMGEDIRSMRVFYYFDTSETAGAKAADCQLKSGLRWFDHSASTSDCSWDLLKSVRFEIVMESNRGSEGTLSQNPHTGESNDRIKSFSFFAVSPSSFSEAE